MAKKQLFSWITFTIVLFLGHALEGQNLDHYTMKNSLIAQPNPSQTQASTMTDANHVPLLYAHVGGALGFDYMSSSDIKSLFEKDFGIGIDFSKGLLLKGGFSNIFQVEYRFGYANHNFNYNDITGQTENITVNMDYKFQDMTYKLNPLFFATQGKKWNCFYVTYSMGNIDWYDEAKDGFEGTSIAYGIEYGIYQGYLNFLIGLKNYTIEFDKVTLNQITANEDVLKANNLILECSLSVGFGIL